jgi:hypothetical protein
MKLVVAAEDGVDVVAERYFGLLDGEVEVLGEMDVPASVVLVRARIMVNFILMMFVSRSRLEL